MKGNNIYLYSIQSNSSEQHTTNGEENKVYNGIPDWVYEGKIIAFSYVCVYYVYIIEEVLATNYALWWSPGGQYILYFTFNDTLVN